MHTGHLLNTYTRVMAIPKFHEFMLPVLQLTADGKIHTASETMARAADRLSLSDQDRRERIPSGKQTVLYNRVTWAITYLVKAGLLERPQRGQYRVTEFGQQVIRNPPVALTKSWLKEHCAGFDKFVTKRSDTPSGNPMPDPDDDRTPEEQIGQLFEQINTDLAEEIVAQIKQCPPEFFERLVIDVLVSMGYGGSRSDAGQAVGQSGDGGIDGIINEDRLGLDSIYVQAKRWENTVGRPHIQAFAGSLEGARARKGVFITTSTFAQPAKDYVRSIEKRIVLIDGEALARLMIEHDVGVTAAETFRVKKIDSDYFENGL